MHNVGPPLVKELHCPENNHPCISDSFILHSAIRCFFTNLISFAKQANDSRSEDCIKTNYIKSPTFKIQFSNTKNIPFHKEYYALYVK